MSATEPTKNEHAQALALLGKGKKRKLSQIEKRRRVKRMAAAREFRWTRKDDVELLKKVDEDAGVG